MASFQLRVSTSASPLPPLNDNDKHHERRMSIGSATPRLLQLLRPASALQSVTSASTRLSNSGSYACPPPIARSSFSSSGIRDMTTDAFMDSRSDHSVAFTPEAVRERIDQSVLAAGEDPARIDEEYRPFLVTGSSTDEGASADWTKELVFAEGEAGLGNAAALALALPRPIKVLVLYGSLRERSFSRFMAYEAARLLSHMGCDVRVYSPRGLPLKVDCPVEHLKVQELRNLMSWSDANFWCSPEQHGNITGIQKTILDHVPLSTGSVRPTQGKILAVSQVNGGSQSFNAVNSLRILGRWMRMFVIPNQASLPMAWKCFDEPGRMLPSSNRERLVDVCEELVKVSALFAGNEPLFADRWSERTERAKNAGKLLTQEQKEKEKEAAAGVGKKDAEVTATKE